MAKYANRACETAVRSDVQPQISALLPKRIPLLWCLHLSQCLQGNSPALSTELARHGSSGAKSGRQSHMPAPCTRARWCPPRQCTPCSRCMLAAWQCLSTAISQCHSIVLSRLCITRGLVPMPATAMAMPGMGAVAARTMAMSAPIQAMARFIPLQEGISRRRYNRTTAARQASICPPPT